jgi:CBS-domain-containing membrane protein
VVARTREPVVIGIVSEGDLIGHAQIVGEPRRSWWLRLFDDENTLAREYAKTHARVAQDVMTSTVITVTPTASLAEIAKTLEHDRIKRVPVVHNGKLVGIVTRSNLLQALAAADVSKPASLDDRTIRERLLKELKCAAVGPHANEEHRRPGWRRPSLGFGADQGRTPGSAGCG